MTFFSISAYLPPPAAALCCWGGPDSPPSRSALPVGGARRLCTDSSCKVACVPVARIYGRHQNQWSHRRALLLPAGRCGARQPLFYASRASRRLCFREDIRLSQPIIRRDTAESLLTAQSIDLRRASDPRIERVADRLGRSALIDQRQRDARVSGSLYPMTLSYACGSTR